MKSAPARWSSWFAFNLAAIGAAVGLGSIWRFPYLAGTNGGSAFLLVFILACVVIATQLLAAEFIIGSKVAAKSSRGGGSSRGSVWLLTVVELDWRAGHACLRAHPVELHGDCRMGDGVRLEVRFGTDQPATALGRPEAQSFRIAMGSDAVFTGFGENTRDLEWFVKAGMTPAQALDAATLGGVRFAWPRLPRSQLW